MWMNVPGGSLVESDLFAQKRLTELQELEGRGRLAGVGMTDDEPGTALSDDTAGVQRDELSAGAGDNALDLELEGQKCVHGILKRPDEKYVTERAYDNPKFVEDMVRDIAGELNNDERIRQYVLESENFESIHNHSAYALIEFNKDSD